MDFDKPFAQTQTTWNAVSARRSSAAPASSAPSRSSAAPDPWGSAVLDASASETRPFSVGDASDSVMPTRRLW